MRWDSGGFTYNTPYELMEFSGASSVIDFNVDDFQVGTEIAGLNRYTFAIVGNTLTVTANLSASSVPEPSTYALIAGLATLALAAWRRRGRQRRWTS